MGARNRLDHLVQTLPQPLLHRRLEPLDHAIERGGIGDHGQRLGRARLDRLEADHGGIGRVDAAADDGVHVGDDLRRDQDRVDGLMRVRAVAALPLHADVDPIDGGHHRAPVEPDMARRQGRPVVQREHPLSGKALEQAVLDHFARTSVAFLTGLEVQVHRAIETARLGQVPRCAEQHGAMPVVPTAVHAARYARAVRRIAQLGDGQRVHVGPKPHGGTTGLGFAIDHRHDTGSAYAGVGGQPQSPKVSGDLRGCPVLLEPQFGMAVEISADVNEFAFESANGVDGVVHEPLTRSRGSMPT